MVNALKMTAGALGLSLLASAAAADDLKTFTVAGGCFWCVESDFDTVPGVVETISGYTGGTLDNPTYQQVVAGGSGHLEAVQITYDPGKISYQELLTAFWSSVDPTDPGGQFCDRGESYQTAIFVADDAERQLAEASKEAAEAYLSKEVVTPIKETATFFPAEDYHQDYYLKNPVRYRYYRWSCGREQRVQDVWGDRAYEGIPKHSS
ncbi:MAG: peptide-methionine (S)-S-oxide reductase MsrA [Pseudomonadota bacterium]